MSHQQQPAFWGSREAKTEGIDATQYKRRKGGGEEGSWRGEERELLKNKSLRGKGKVRSSYSE